MNYTEAADIEVRFDFSLVSQRLSIFFLFYIFLVLTYLNAEDNNRNTQYSGNY